MGGIALNTASVCGQVIHRQYLVFVMEIQEIITKSHTRPLNIKTINTIETLTCQTIVSYDIT